MRCDFLGVYSYNSHKSQVSSLLLLLLPVVNHTIDFFCFPFCMISILVQADKNRNRWTLPSLGRANEMGSVSSTYSVRHQINESIYATANTPLDRQQDAKVLPSLQARALPSPSPETRGCVVCLANSSARCTRQTSFWAACPGVERRPPL